VALPEVARQFRALVNDQRGVFDASIESAPSRSTRRSWPTPWRSLEKRFGRKLKAEVKVVPELIGGIRVVVGDEVLDTSVQRPSGTNESGAHALSATPATPLRS
jgi:F-type H+-transporting ATPase subunit delta